MDMMRHRLPTALINPKHFESSGEESLLTFDQRMKSYSESQEK